MRLLRLSLISLKVRGLKKSLDEKSRTAVREVLQKDSVKMVQAWSVDFDYGGAGSVFRPDAVFVRQGDSLTASCEKIMPPGKRICVKIVDILGNTAFVELSKESGLSGVSAAE